MPFTVIRKFPTKDELENPLADGGEKSGGLSVFWALWGVPEEKGQLGGSNRE